MATETTKLTYIEGAAASTPAASRTVIYAKADGLMYSKDDAGTETLMSGGAGGGIAATIFDAKGDIIAATAADTASRLAVGTNGQVLTAASGQATGLQWATPSGIVHSQLGTTSAGASFNTVRQNYAKKITLASAAYIMSIGAFVKAISADLVGMYAFVLTDSSGPANIIGNPSAMEDSGSNAPLDNMVLSTTVRAIEMPVCRRLAAGDYWIGVHLAAGADNRIVIAFNSATGTDAIQAQVRPHDGSITAWTVEDDDYCIYANILT